MQHLLFSPKGRAALLAALRRRPLLAFDFDGTLAPIVSRPDSARIAPEVAAKLSLISRRLPVAIVTGRSVADVRGRLGFEPQFVFGNHGAEDGLDAAAELRRAQRLDGFRKRLAARDRELAGLGVRIEDKGQSIALHYRRAPARQRALDAIMEVLPTDPALRVFPGKMVANVVAAESPDKAVAMLGLAARIGAGNVIFAGDDVNDEAVFVAAPPSWLTVHIGRDVERSAARFFLDSPAQVATWLQWILDQSPMTDVA